MTNDRGPVHHSGKKRTLSEAELRVIIYHVDLYENDSTKLKKGVTLHIARATVNGALIQACNGRFMDKADGDIDVYPYWRFMVEAGPVCGRCARNVADKLAGE